MVSIKTAGLALLACALMVFLLDAFFPPPLHRAERVSSLVFDRHGVLLHAFATPDGRWRFKAVLDDIDEDFIDRLVRIEDKRFYHHHGVDGLAVARASFSVLRRGKIVSGASTITMQTARLLEPRPRTIGSKVIEMIRALQIERRLSKREILEMYLTLAPYGGNIEGVGAASRLYFGKGPRHLTDAEQALLLALPQAPEARRPDLHPVAARKARRKLAQKLVRHDVLSHERAREIAAVPVPKTRRALPRMAYHAARDLSLKSDRLSVHSSLDAPLQENIEALVAHHVASLNDGATAAVMVVENETRAVRALVGSSGFDVPGGWIDLTRAVRSPGSTLKPFIYGLAFDDGLANAQTLIDDMPRAFGGYTPENFDRTFRGEVRIREALQHSLNLPAVQALEGVGARRFSSVLRSAGIAVQTPQRHDQKAGLAIALGGAGVSARDIAKLYCALANGGEVRPLRWTDDAEASEPKRLLSPRAARQIGHILSDVPALAGRAPANLTKGAAHIAFKTGTSYGYRDAWAAGYNSAYTIVVWVGRADGASRPGQTGRKAAAPLLFDLFDRVNVSGVSGDDFQQSEDSKEQRVLSHFRTRPDTREVELVFPRDGIEVFLPKDDRGFALAARGGKGVYRWYVDGTLISQASLDRRAVWHPEKPGFYTVTVIDQAGKQARAHIRVHL